MEPFFLKVKKNTDFLEILPTFQILHQITNFIKKASLWRLIIYGCRTFKKKNSLIAVAVSEIIRNARTHGRTDGRTRVIL